MNIRNTQDLNSVQHSVVIIWFLVTINQVCIISFHLPSIVNCDTLCKTHLLKTLYNYNSLMSKIKCLTECYTYKVVQMKGQSKVKAKRCTADKNYCITFWIQGSFFSCWMRILGEGLHHKKLHHYFTATAYKRDG